MSTNDPLIGRQLGDYVIEGLLGQGGMARVYRGYDAKLDRYAAVKVTEPKLIASDDEAEYTERFLREARSIARLNHPRVVGIFQFGQIDNLYYMAMGFIEGKDLRHILKELTRQEKRLTYDQVLRIVRDIGDALDYAHRQGVIHRDVKPSNIMVTGDGHAVLTDFGLALNAAEGTIGNTFGSVHYIAPEQAVSSAQAVPQSDLYSLGVVIYEMLTRRVPFEDVSAMSVALKHISDPPPPLSAINNKISSTIEQVVMKTLDKDPKRRYPTGAALAHALEEAIAVSDDEDTHELDPAGAAALDTPVPDDKALKEVVASTIAVPMPIVPPYEDAPTISDSSQMRPGSLPFAPEPIQQERSNRRPALIGALAIIALALAGIIALLASLATDGDEAEATRTAESIAESAVALLIDATDESTPEASEPAPIDATDEITPEPTDETTPEETEAPTATRTPRPTRTTEATATVEPTATIRPTRTTAPTRTVTATFTEAPTTAATPTLALTASPGEPEVVLRYDGRTLVLYNRTPGAGTTINVANLVFTGPSAGGPSVRFEATEWPVDAARRLRSQDCFQLWPFNTGPYDEDEFPADICRARQGFRTGRNTSFWLSTETGATFEVFRLGVPVATCPTVTPASRDEVICLIDVSP
jgi:serine/threonine protein kinase